ncbi:MAG TPA: Spy/CpxP family protein refolding chaperone [Pyrinomonadaceae bacterium]|jgi:Spy/CpxP family protein refolding chaperone
MKNAFTKAALALSLVAVFAVPGVFAQQQSQQPSTQDGAQDEQPMHRKGRMGRGGRHQRKGGRGHGFGRLAQQLNLTDAQQEQLRAIRERNAESFRAKRREMRELIEARRDGATFTAEQQARADALRQEFRANAERMHSEFLAILTPEQRTQLEQLKKQHQERRQEFRERRRERRMDDENDEQ